MKNSTLKSLFLKKKIPICPPFSRFMCITTETALFRSEDSVAFFCCDRFVSLGALPFRSSPRNRSDDTIYYV